MIQSLIDFFQYSLLEQNFSIDELVNSNLWIGKSALLITKKGLLLILDTLDYGNSFKIVYVLR